MIVFMFMAGFILIGAFLFASYAFVVDKQMDHEAHYEDSEMK
jgi:Ni,Fe-hydrogenase I cytochrome b subunit